VISEINIPTPDPWSLTSDLALKLDAAVASLTAFYLRGRPCECCGKRFDPEELGTLWFAIPNRPLDVCFECGVDVTWVAVCAKEGIR
jgi:hypothetical protein